MATERGGVETTPDCKITIQSASGLYPYGPAPTSLLVEGTAAGCSKLVVNLQAEAYNCTREVPVVNGTWQATCDSDQHERMPACGSKVLVTVHCAEDKRCSAERSLAIHCQPGQKDVSANTDFIATLADGGLGYRAAPYSIGELGYLLRNLGLNWDVFMHSIAIVDARDVGPFLEFLRSAALGPRASLPRLRFYLEFARTVFPHERFRDWARLLKELWGPNELSRDSTEFVEREEIVALLWRQLVLQCGSEPLVRHERVATVAHLRALFSALESWTLLTAEDPNLLLLALISDRFGSLAEYYKHYEAPRRTVECMIERGFDVDYLVFSDADIVPLDIAVKPTAAWPLRLRQITKEVLGGADHRPRVDLRIDRQRFFHSIRQDYEALATREEPSFGVRLVDALLPVMEERQAQLFRTGELASETMLAEYLYELRSIRNALADEKQEVLVPRRLRARRSPKTFPDLLFDNVRLSCCLFKPAGMFHTEISRLLLDPATPLIEFWLDPYPEFLGLATLYAGVNATGERVLLMDTVDYSDLLLDLHGYNPTMQYMLDAMVVDAGLAGARKLLVFAAPYGKPLNFANFVRRTAEQRSSICYRSDYYFESADPSDSALSSSLTGNHHYTAALGCGRPLVGTIDYGYNLVAPGRVDKLPSGGKGVLEIDVQRYLEERALEHHLTRAVSRVETSTSAVHRRPPHHEHEIGARVDTVLKHAASELRTSVEHAMFQWATPHEVDVCADLMPVEGASFTKHFQYSEEDYRTRLMRKGARVLTLRDGAKPIAHVLCYAGLELDRHELFIDEIAVHPDCQRRGIGSLMLRAVSELGAIGGWRELTLYAPLIRDSPAHAGFYQRAGFTPGRAANGVGQRYSKRLSLLGSSGLGKLLATIEQELNPSLNRPRVTLHERLDGDLLKLMERLEAVFPDRLRYSNEQFGERFSYPDAYAAVFWDGEEAIAFSLSYHVGRIRMAFPALPRHAFFLDTMAVLPSLQGKRIGSTMMRLLLSVPVFGPYTSAVFYCQADWNGQKGLVPYYERFGAKVVDSEHGWARMIVPLAVGTLN